MADRAVHIWADAQGEQTMQLVVTASGVSSIRTQLLAVSNATIVESSEGTIVNYSTTPVVGTYPTVRTTAVLQFTDSVGSIGRLLIPAPLSSIFLSDGVTVDPAAITSLISACIGNLKAGNTNPVTNFLGGQLVATRFGGVSSAQLF